MLCMVPAPLFRVGIETQKVLIGHRTRPVWLDIGGRQEALTWQTLK